MIGYLTPSLKSHLRQGRLLWLLTVFGVALGVASVYSIQLINTGAVASFRGSLKAISGHSDLTLTGKTGPLPETIFPKVLATPGVRSAWPIYRVEARVQDRKALKLEIYASDLTSPVSMPFLEKTTSASANDGFWNAATKTAGWIAISSRLAQEQGWKKGDSINVAFGWRKTTLTIGTIVSSDRVGSQVNRKLAVMDIAQAQSASGGRGILHQIDIRVQSADAEGPRPFEVDRVRENLERRFSPGVEIASESDRTDQARSLLGAFRLNLTALSLISVWVGLFLIYSSTQASLARRRTEFGVLRSLGATRRQVFLLILVESLLLSCPGIVLGIALGHWAAWSNLELVGSTIKNIYLLEALESLRVTPSILGSAVFLGLAGALIGTLPAAWDMSRHQPRSLLQSFTREDAASSKVGYLFGAAAGLLFATAAWYVIWGRGWQPSGFILAGAGLLALPMMTPLVVRESSKRIPVIGFGWLFSLRSLSQRLERSSTSAAALAVASAMLIALTVMIGSFRSTVEVWLHSTLQADVYVSAASWRSGTPTAALRSQTLEALSARPEVRSVDRLRGRFVRFGESRISIVGVDLQMDLPQRFVLKEGRFPEALQQASATGGVLISEPLSRRAALDIGDSLPLDLLEGTVHLPVTGIYYDYASEQGAAVVDWPVFQRLFGQGPPSNLALYLKEGQDTDQVTERLKERFSEEALTFRSNRGLREAALRVFDQTFAIVRLLEVMALLVAVFGVASTLLIMVQERLPELALYRALGAQRHQVAALFLGQGLGMASLGILLGGVTAFGLAGILVLIINRDFFGWTIQFSWPWSAVVREIAIILAAALAASIYPAFRAGKVRIEELNRDAL